MFYCRIARRWIISLLGIYSCALMFAQRAGMSVAMVRMTGSHVNINQSKSPTFDWNETLQGIILGASFYLYWIVPTIVGIFTKYYGGKWFAFVGVFGPCILMAITPWAATSSVYILIAVQTLIGLTHGFTYPALFHLYVQWFPPHERSKANSGIGIGVALGSGLIYLVGGFLCETEIGWPMVFYTGSAFHIPWIFLWLYFASDKPNNMELEEKINIEHQQLKLKQKKIPWSQIATSSAVWSSIICKFACSYGYFMFLSKLPAYLNSVYGIDIVQNGFINAATSFSYGITCFLGPYLSNYVMENTSLKGITIRKIFQSISMLIPAICLILISIFNEQQTIVITLLIVSMLSYGCVTGGEWTMVSDYSPNFVGIVSGITYMLAFISGILAPYIVGMIIDSKLGTLQMKWNISFYISAILYGFGYLVFWLFATDQQQDWDKI